MKMNTNQTERLLGQVTKFPDLPRNHPELVEGSTATDNDRREGIAAILRWWNDQIVPVLTELGHREKNR